MFRSNTPAEGEFRQELWQRLQNNLPQSPRGRAVRPPPEENDHISGRQSHGRRHGVG